MLPQVLLPAMRSWCAGLLPFRQSVQLLCGHWNTVLPQVLLPAMRSALRPSRRRATDGTCVEIAALERLYRIFERC